MAIDRVVIWVYQGLTTLPNIGLGWQFALQSEANAMIAQDCAQDGFTDVRSLKHIVRGPAKDPV